MRITVKQMYDYCVANELKLLSSYASNFWADYRTGNTAFDRAFNRLFKNFVFFEDEYDTVAEAAAAFITAVSDHLMINDKKYAELFRIHVISDENYSLTNNYDMKEIRTGYGGSTKGARTDSSSTTVGSQTVTGKVAPFDSETFANDSESTTGARTDSDSYTSGAQTDSYTDDYTLTRVGNIGVMTATDMLAKHKDFWTVYDFYNYIFMAIAKELLMVE